MTIDEQIAEIERLKAELKVIRDSIANTLTRGVAKITDGASAGTGATILYLDLQTLRDMERDIENKLATYRILGGSCV